MDIMDTVITAPGNSQIMARAVEVLTEATEEDKRKNYENAIRLYELGAEYSLFAISSGELKQSTIEIVHKRIAIYLERSDKIKKYLQKKRMEKLIVDYACGECLGKEDLEEKEDLSELLQRLDIGEKPHVNWFNIFGLHQAKEVLIQAFIMPLKFPHLFTSKRIPWKSILLFGPPGTGKTLLAKALAGRVVNSTFILFSNCLGESERLLKSLVKNRTQEPTIILIDEIDVIFKTESARTAKMELLTYMQDPRKENDRILILATTSEPWLLDDALLKRFDKKIYTPLPDTTERLQILKFCLGDTPHNFTETDLQELAVKTEGYSGGDISNLVQEALMQPVRKVKSATHYRRISGPSRRDPNLIVHDLLTPCSPAYTGAIEMSWEEIPGDKLLEPLPNMCDMYISLHCTKPTTDEYSLRRYERFEEYLR